MKRFLLSIFSLSLLTGAQQLHAQSDALDKFTEAFGSKKTTSARAKKAPETPDSTLHLTWIDNKYDSTEVTKSQYNQDGLPTVTVSKFLNDGKWFESTRITYRYDANKNVISQLYENKYGEEWYASSRDTSVYDSEGYKTLSLYQYFNGSEWETSGGEKMIIDYIQSGTKNLPVSRITQMMDSTGGWANMEKMEATVENGKYKEARQFSWNDTLGDWELVVKMTDLEFYNDRIDMPTKATVEIDLGGGMWMEVFRITSTMNSDGQPMTQIMEMNNFLGGGWEPRSKVTYRYDVFGNETGSTTEEYDGQSKMTSVSRINLVYSNDHTVLEREYEIDSTNSGRFTKINKEIMGYQGVTSIADNGRPAFEVSLYPNPATDKLNIAADGLTSGATLTLTDATGKQVNAIRISPSSMPAQLDLNGLKPGMYIVRLQSGSASVSKTIIKN